jgi:hypothetical protein
MILFSSPSIDRIVQSRSMRQAGHMERMGRCGTCIVIDRKTRGKETTRKAKTWVGG